MSVTIIWLDESVAKIFHFSEDRMEREILPLDPVGSDPYERLVDRLGDSKQVLILSPGYAGGMLEGRIRSRSPELGKRIVGCETLIRADDVAVADYAIKYFRKPLRRSV